MVGSHLVLFSIFDVDSGLSPNKNKNTKAKYNMWYLLVLIILPFSALMLTRVYLRGAPLLTMAQAGPPLRDTRCSNYFANIDIFSCCYQILHQKFNWPKVIANLITKKGY